jgi:hypothetical protein
LKAAQAEDLDLDAIGRLLLQYTLASRPQADKKAMQQSAETFAQSVPDFAQKLYNVDFFVQYAQRFYAALPPVHKQAHRLPFRYAPRAQAYASQLDGYVECTTGERFYFAVASSSEDAHEPYTAHLQLAAAALGQEKARLLLVYPREGRCVEVAVKYQN